jgi:CMP/dCMP kinase
MELKQKIIIAIDGFSSCGKSSFAKLIAKDLNYIFIDTGAMYRAVSLYAIQHKMVSQNSVDSRQLLSVLKSIKISFQRKGDKVFTYLNNINVEDEIRGIEVSSLVSEVSKIKEVREYLVSLQQEMGMQKGIVMDGRDIGTVVFPNAEVKIYMTASSDVRAKRRFDELTEKGLKVSLEEIKNNIEDRDYNDLNRKESPLKQAKDASILDNSNMTFAEQMQWFKKLLISKNYLEG